MNAHSFPVINLQRTGRNIEQLRRAAGLSVRQLQDYFGFEYPQAIYKWQHGECLPTVDNLLALSRLLGVPMDELLICEDQELPAFLGDRRLFFATEKDVPAGAGNVLYACASWGQPPQRACRLRRTGNSPLSTMARAVARSVCSTAGPAISASTAAFASRSRRKPSSPRSTLRRPISRFVSCTCVSISTQVHRERSGRVSVAFAAGPSHICSRPPRLTHSSRPKPRSRGSSRKGREKSVMFRCRRYSLPQWGHAMRPPAVLNTRRHAGSVHLFFIGGHSFLFCSCAYDFQPALCVILLPAFTIPVYLHAIFRH